VVGYLALFYILLLHIKDQKTRLLAVYYGLLLTIAISTSWFIPVVVCLAVLFIIALPLLKSHTRSIVALGIVGGLCPLLIIYCLFSSETLSAGDMLTMWGGYPIMHRLFVYIIGLATIAYVIYQKIIAKQQLTSAALLYIIISLLFVILVYVFFIFKQGMVSYYYYKIETTFLAISLPVVLVFGARLLYSYKKALIWLSFVVIGGFYFGSLPSDKNNAYLQYITDINNVAATVEIDAGAVILEKLDQPIYDEAHRTCTIIINKIYQETVNASALANNTTNRPMYNNCMIAGYLDMFNNYTIDFQAFVDKANQNGVPYEIWGKAIDGDLQRLVNVSDQPNVSLHEY
jgi:hypothetical protein